MILRRTTQSQQRQNYYYYYLLLFALQERVHTQDNALHRIPRRAAIGAPDSGDLGGRLTGHQ